MVDVDPGMQQISVRNSIRYAGRAQDDVRGLEPKTKVLLKT